MKYALSNSPFFVLAPMDDVTDSAFRQVISSITAPDIFFTEFTNVDGLQSPGRDRVRQKLYHTDKETPLIAQIWGLKPENFYATARQIADGEFGDFIGVDLNMGCPDKTVVKNGACSGLINNRELAKEIIDATRDGLNGKLPLSVKTRLGFSSVDMSWIEYLLEQNLDMLSIHGRTRKQMSKVPANWNLIGEAREMRDHINPSTLIVGNGDVLTRQQGLELANQFGLDGVMVGRGIFSDPTIFSEKLEWENYSPADKLSMFFDHATLFKNTWAGSRPVHILNKFAKVYVSGFDGAKEIREELMASHDVDELLRSIADKRFMNKIVS